MIKPVIEAREVDLALPANATAFLNLLNEYALDPMGGGKELSPFVKANLVSELQKRDQTHIVFGIVDGVTAGLIVSFEGFSTFSCRPLLNIHDIIVSKEYRGQGLCKKMLQKTEAIALSLDCCKLTLEVLAGNTRAQAAYRAFGFAGYELDPTLGQALFWEKKLV